MSTYFLRTARLGFRRWTEDDLPLARALWSDPQVSRFISKDGFDDDYIRARLAREMADQARTGRQYWPVFQLANDAHIGCCGLRTRDVGAFPEFGVHLRPEFWGRGYALEAGRGVLAYGFSQLGLTELFAGHHPDNTVSAKMLLRLGFEPSHRELYPPTGLMHPCYRLLAP